MRRQDKCQIYGDNGVNGGILSTWCCVPNAWCVSGNSGYTEEDNGITEATPQVSSENYTLAPRR